MCLPDKESGKEAYEIIKKELEKDPNFGTLL